MKKTAIAIAIFATNTYALEFPQIGEYPGLSDPPANQAQLEWHGLSSAKQWAIEARYAKWLRFDTPEQACQYAVSVRYPRNAGWTLGNDAGVYTTAYHGSQVEATQGWRQVVATTDQSLQCKAKMQTRNRWLHADSISPKTAPQSCMPVNKNEPFPIQFWLDTDQEYLPVLFLDSGKYFIDPPEWPLILGYYPDGDWDQSAHISIDDNCEPISETTPNLLVCTPLITYAETTNGLEYWSTPHKGKVNYRVVGAAEGAVHTEGCVEFTN